MKYAAISPKGLVKQYKRLPWQMDARLCYVDLVTGEDVSRTFSISRITLEDGRVIDASETVQREFEIQEQSRVKARELGLLK